MDALVELLSDLEKANAVMQTLTSYVVYVYPGIISIYLYNFFMARTTQNTQAFVIKSFAISFFYNICLKEIIVKINCINMPSNEVSVIYNIYLILIAFLIPYCCFRLKMSKVLSIICNKCEISTSTTNVPFELLGNKEENYTCLKIYLKSDPCAYIGYLGEYEYEEGYERYVIITGYKKYLILSDMQERLIVGYDAEDYQEKVFIRLDDIKRIEKLGENRAKKEIYKNGEKK